MGWICRKEIVTLFKDWFRTSNQKPNSHTPLQTNGVLKMTRRMWTTHGKEDINTLRSLHSHSPARFSQNWTQRKLIKHKALWLMYCSKIPVLLLPMFVILVGRT